MFSSGSICIFGSIIIQVIHAISVTATNDTIILPRAISFPQPTISPIQYFHVKHMPAFRFDLRTASSTFVKIPGLIVAVYHSAPVLYKVWFSAGCYMSQPVGSHYIHFMIDDLILIDNKLLPNTDDRYAYVPNLGNNPMEIDAHGASFMRSSDSVGTYYTCSKFELVYLPAGLHTIEAAVRTDHPSILVHTGTLTVELTQYDQDTNIGLKFPSKI